MISEGSRVTEDWSNDAEKSADINYILKYIKMHLKKCSIDDHKKRPSKT